MGHTIQPQDEAALEASLAALRPHDHLCLIFDSEEEQHRTTVPFVRRGLGEGDRCLCVADSGNADAVAGALRRGAVDVDGAVARGALEVATERTTYLAGGAFDPERMCGVVRAAAHAAVAGGFRALRIAGEVTWATGDERSWARVMEYEASVNSLLPTIPALALCLYDRRRFPAEVIRDVIRTHPLALVRGRICRNLYYVPPGELVGPDRLHADVDRLLENLLERELAEDALRESERRLALVLEGAQEAFWDWDVAADRITWSAPWARRFGLAPSARAAGVWTERIHPEDRDRTLATWAAHLRGETPAFLGEYRVRDEGGTYRWVSSRGRVVERAPDGRPLRVAGTIVDVTERRELQSRLELATRLASVGTLAAGVAHEINNPLTFVDANLRWALDELARPGGAPGEALREALSEALTGARRVREIVQELTRFARSPADGEAVPADVAAELAAAVAIVRRQIEVRARLEVDLAPELPRVRMSGRGLGQVVVNLLVNAAEAIPEGAATLHAVRLGARAAEGEVTITVSDTGRGILPEVLPHVFDPFFTTKRIGEGKGLGLAICHGIVQASGGRIEVRSEPGRGTTFTVALPAAGAAAAAPPAPARVAPGPRRRVLVIDDEPLVARAIARTLAREHDVETLTSSAEALRRLEAGERWDLVLCDLVMPELTGPQLAAKLRASAPDALRAFVFMTGGAYTEASAAFLATGAHRHVEKPIEPEVLRALAAGAERVEPS